MAENTQTVAGAPVDARPTRPRDIASMSIVIVGAGVGGLCMAARLREAGARNIQILEKGDSVGGTWRINRYPGIACDVPTHHYSFTFFRNPGWTRVLAEGSEIKRYLERMARKLDLNQHLRLNTEVKSTTYRPDGTWSVKIAGGSEIEADVLIMATGFLHVPRYPNIEGLDNFDGPVIHTARWQDVELKGKRVAVVGVGSSGCQVITAIAEEVESLTVFQRTAQWVGTLENMKYSWWQRTARRLRPSIMVREYDAFMKLFAEEYGIASLGDKERLKPFEEMVEANLATIKDPELRRKMTPNYQPLCKRLVYAPGFYPAIQHPNVEVVTEDIDKVDAKGVLTVDGEFHDLDVIILATGFKADAYFRAIEVNGENGQKLEEAWSDGPQSFQTVTLAGFPNMFMVGGPFSPLGQLANPPVAEAQVGNIVRTIQHMAATGATAVVPKARAQDEFMEYVRSTPKGSVWLSGCTSWFLDSKGRPGIWTHSPMGFIEMMNKGPNLDDYETIVAKEEVR